MKSSRDRMRKDEMQLTMSLIPLAMESKRLFPSEKHSRGKKPITITLISTNLRGFFLTWVQAGELAALFGIFPKVLTTLGTLAQRRHAHLWLAVVTRAAQTRVVPLGGEVVALVHHIVLYVHAGLSCGEETWRQRRFHQKRVMLDGGGGGGGGVRTPLAEEGELLVAVLGVPAVKTPFVHVFDLKALKLGTEDAVLGRGGLVEVGQALRRQKHLHRT